jgi:hypothetical protein
MMARKIIATLLLAMAVSDASAAVIFRAGQQTGDPGNTNLISTLDWLQFLDGSSLHGKLSAMDVTNGVRWDHPDARQPAQFAPPNIDSISFEGGDRIFSKEKTTCKFRFVNGDEVFGNLTSLDEKKIHFDSWLGKNLEATRDSVRSLAFQGFSVAYEGPTGMAGWSVERGNNVVTWEYRDGAFITSHNGVIGRDVKLPANSSIEFDLAWSGQFVMLMPLYTEVVDRFDFNNSCYVLYIGGNSIGLQRVHPTGGGIMYIGTTVATPVFAKKNRAHIEIRSNKAEARFALYIDGVLTGKWKDDNGFIAAGTGVAFAAQMSGPMLKVSNIRVSESDGKTEELNDKAGNEDALYLANRDKITGTVGSSHDGKVSLATWQNPSLQIPMERVRQIVFASSAQKALEPNPWKVRVSFAGGGALSLLLDKWSDQEVSGVHPNFGRVTFDPKTVRQLEFNLQHSRTGEATDGDDSSDKPANVADQDTLLFDNGDTLLGNLESFDPKESLRWIRADTKQAIEFSPARLTEMRLHPRPVTATTTSKINFYDGDEFEGNILDLDSDKVTVDSWYAGKVQLARKSVRALTPAPPQRTITFKGPEGLEGWTVGKVTTIPDPGEWSYRDGAFYATKSAAIARDVHLPDRASIQFDLKWKGALGVALALYTSSLQPVNLANKENEPDFGGFYSLQLNNTFSSQLISVKKHDTGGNPTLGVVTVPAFHQKDNARVEVRVDKRRKMIALLVDGALMNRWFDVEGFAGTGTAVRFVHHGNGAIKMNNFLVTDWDGQFEEPLFPIATNTVDVAKLRNGDQVTGSLNAMREDQISFTTGENKKMDIPWSRVKQLEFKKPAETRNGSSNSSNTVQAFYIRGGSVKFRLEKWNQQGISASSPNFGKLTFNPGAFDRIRFKLDKLDAVKIPDESTPAQ